MASSRAKTPGDGVQMHDTALQILDAASRLFAAQGFSATTVREIMLECGITQAALYLYFPSKDAVLAELIRVGYAHLTNALDEAEAASDESDPADCLAHLVAGFVGYATNHTLLARVADQEWRHLEGDEHDNIAELRRSVRGRFERVIDDGIAAGVFTVVDPEGTAASSHQTRFLATSIVDMCTGIFSWYSTTGHIDVPLMSDRYQRVALRMCGHAPRRTRRRTS